MHAPAQKTIPAELLLMAYRSGIFPMADSRDDEELYWVEPRERAVVESSPGWFVSRPEDPIDAATALDWGLVNRVFADLERQGLIERAGREIAFKRWPELRRLASFQPAYLERHSAFPAASAAAKTGTAAKPRLHH